jgi:hypothetical protein
VRPTEEMWMRHDRVAKEEKEERGLPTKEA